LRRSRKLGLLLALISGISAFAVAPVPAFAERVSYETFVSVLPQAPGRKVIDIRDKSINDRGEAQLWALNNEGQQRWIITSIGAFRHDDGNIYTEYTLENVRSHRCLDKSMDRGNYDGAPVYQYGCSEMPNQVWYFKPVAGSDWGMLASMEDDRCLDVKDVNYNNGSRLQVWKCSGNWNQRWNIKR
jgi:hypothetical protein